MIKPIVLATFLPQFHECEFNNHWWGKGFTEWSNVKRAKSLRTGHIQPKVPKDGEYDLTDPLEISTQYAQAYKNGIDGFSIYHYWYEGKRPLGKVLSKILEDPSIELKFSLCWANHSWTRSWRNRAGTLDVLINQTYEENPDDERKHFDFLVKVFKDKRYIHLKGRPVFQIYIPEDIPDITKFLNRLSNYCLKNIGKKPILIGTIRRPTKIDEYSELFDYILLAQPVLGLNFDYNSFFGIRKVNRSLFRAKILQSPLWVKKFIFRLQDLIPSKPRFIDYCSTQKNCLSIIHGFLSKYRNVLLMSFVDFDNTPRYSKRATVMSNYSDQCFYHNLKSTYHLAQKNNHPLFYINAWNEWGEGMYLQSCSEHQTTKLDIVKKVLSGDK